MYCDITWDPSRWVYPTCHFAEGPSVILAYDLGRRLERLPTLAADDENLPEMAIGLYDWAVVVDHLEKKCWLAGQGRDPETLSKWHSLIARFSAPQSVSRVPFRVLGRVSSNMDRACYAAGLWEDKALYSRR